MQKLAKSGSVVLQIKINSTVLKILSLFCVVLPQDKELALSFKQVFDVFPQVHVVPVKLAQ